MEPFIAQITMFGGNFAPRDWAFCNGQLLPISQYDALFSLLGTTYGGDGRTTFALPDLRGRAPIHAGRGPGLTERPLGAKGGNERVTLTVSQMPMHDHIATSTATGTIKASSQNGTTNVPTNNILATAKTPVDRSTTYDTNMYAPATSSNVNMAANDVTVSVSTTVQPAGGNQAINNMQPWGAVNYIIALQGVYPTRS